MPAKGTAAQVRGGERLDNALELRRPEVWNAIVWAHRSHG
jgi:hypothetical protein